MVDNTCLQAPVSSEVLVRRNAPHNVEFPAQESFRPLMAPERPLTRKSEEKRNTRAYYQI